MEKYIFIRNEKALINCKDIVKIAIKTEGDFCGAEYYIEFNFDNEKFDIKTHRNDGGDADATLKKIMDYLAKDTDYILDI